ncbi:F-box protein At3g07870-like isoform X2 [Impatiens glandulifera]|uniref:F-box protein At3g07870-like isoform X1 n=1 Tax=Impatiens glandulifera TaxID=253017 RepID=UPI001FB17920|nr:F-box protein At3g07870-like isoform X1 [Impatiens glandulifera]XP_047337115.1 F-box protein At3g07870-like isoform X2 [Impatiens glandulifera]
MDEGVGGASPSIDQVPNHILADILSRLPIKSLIQCRSVCKSFLYLISADPDFRSLHLSRSTPELLLYHFVSKKMILFDSDADQAHLLPPRFDRHYDMIIVNSCRGLLCLRSLRTSFPFYVFNPISSEFTLIPNPVVIESEDPVSLMVGFGYSPISDKYKIIKVSKSRDSTGKNCFHTDIYTIGPPSSSSWRRVENAPIQEVTECFSMFLNGRLYWIMNENVSIYCYEFMIYFDFDSETFGTTLLPPPFDISRYRDTVAVVNFGAFQGMLRISVLTDSGNNPHIWVMKEFGVDKSWCLDELPFSFPGKYINNNKSELLVFMAGYYTATYSLIEKKIVYGKLKPFSHVPILLPLKELLVGVEVHLLNSTQSKNVEDEV